MVSEIFTKHHFAAEAGIDDGIKRKRFHVSLNNSPVTIDVLAVMSDFHNIVIRFRYSLPFVVATHHEKSPWLIEESQSDKNLLNGFHSESLRIVWNIAWHDGIDAALTSSDENNTRFCV